jgi:hypothetical protein
MELNPVLIPIVAIVFSLAIPIVAIICDHFTSKNRMKLMEKAIEKGITLEGLSFDKRNRGPRVPYRSGMILLAIGIGICGFGILIGQKETDAFWPLLGLGLIPVLIGIALIINDRINYEKLFKKDTDAR